MPSQSTIDGTYKGAPDDDVWAPFSELVNLNVKRSAGRFLIRRKRFENMLCDAALLHARMATDCRRVHERENDLWDEVRRIILHESVFVD